MFKTILLITLFPSLFFAQSITDFNWLVGKWKVQSDHSEIYEEWWIDNNELLGLGYSIKENEKVISEHLIIKLIGNKVVYIASPVKQTPTLFNLVKHENSNFTFENLEHDFPQRIIYTKITDNEFHARVEGLRSGKMSGFEIVFHKWHTDDTD